MKAEATSLLKLFQGLHQQQFVIPVYQRHYSWKEKHCKKLWDDLIRAGESSGIDAHFIGSVVYIGDSGNISQKLPLSVIDGQQRLTTGTLLITALADYLDTLDKDSLPNNFSAEMLRNCYLFNQYLRGEQYFKLILSKTDKDTLLAILRKEPPLEKLKMQESSKRVVENYQLFRKLISEYKGCLDAVYQGLEKLMVVDVKLDRHDDPQMIFESMNSTGLDLSQADLIRNYVLMNLKPDEQTELYTIYWQKMEDSFGDDYDNHFDPFMRYYLIAKTGKIPNMRDVYEAFKSYARDNYTLNKNTLGLLADIKTYADYYRSMVLNKETDANLKSAFCDLKELKIDVVYPFLLDAYHHYNQNILKAKEFLEIVRLVESYVFRRMVCSIPTNSLNKVFPALIDSLKKDSYKDCYLESVKAFFILLLSSHENQSSSNRFPNDDDFQRDIKVRDLYNIRNNSYWLRRLENHGSKEPISVENYTIEHIMPQNKKLSKEWQNELGINWQHIQQTWLHTLGNLTLTGYNSEYSDKPFKFKQKEAINKDKHEAGFNSSPFKLNRWEFEIFNEQSGEKEKYSLATVPKWNEEAIQSRADCLALEATKVWSIPKLALDILDKYRSNIIQSTEDEDIDG